LNRLFDYYYRNKSQVLQFHKLCDIGSVQRMSRDSYPHSLHDSADAQEMFID